MSRATVAGVYAEALLACADEAGRRESVLASCRILVTALTREQIAALDDPRLGRRQAKAALGAALDQAEADRLVADLLRLLIDRNRLADAPAILAEALRQADDAAHVIHVEVTAAAPLAPVSQERLRAALDRDIDGRVELEVRIDPDLIAGLTVRHGDFFLDGSARRRLHEMKNLILSAPVADELWDGAATGAPA
jgi:F-type H+-transporting ATPase subunit delta